jgi:hypothetical protein
MEHPTPTQRQSIPVSNPKPIRGFMLDTARCQENRAYYRNFIDFCAARGINTLLWHFTDDQGCSLQFDACPAIASPNAYSKAEMRALVQYAGDRRIDIVPELASLGHSRYLTCLPEFRHLNENAPDAHFTGMCPVSDETRRIIRKLIEETAEVFDSPNFHVGLDEVNIGEHPLTRAALESKTRGHLQAEYAVFVHGIVTSLGRRMWMWGDGLLKHPEMLAHIPRDVVICNWQYTPQVSPDTTRTLLDAGFDVMLCSALISHDQPLYPGEHFALPNLRTLESQRSPVNTQQDGDGQKGQIPGNILGHINTIWTPVRYIADSLWLAVDVAAAILRHGIVVDTRAQAQSFAQSFYGLPAEMAVYFSQAAEILLRHSPMRKEWLAVVKLAPLASPIREEVSAASGHWTRAYALLRKVAPSVRRNAIEYRAFLLLAETIAHTYEVASRLPDPAISSTTIARWIKRGQNLLERVDRNWDRERFADDPRKHTAPIASFQNDHLIPLLLQGLTALKERATMPTQNVTVSVMKKRPAATVKAG